MALPRAGFQSFSTWKLIIILHPSASEWSQIESAGQASLQIELLQISVVIYVPFSAQARADHAGGLSPSRQMGRP